MLWQTPGRILFGAGTAVELPGLVTALGRRVGLLTGRHPERHEALVEQLEVAGLQVVLALPVATEPSEESCDEAGRRAREAKADVIVAVGGGAVIDTGKAVAGRGRVAPDLRPCLEIVGEGRALTGALPLIAVPTTAGSGAEATRNAVVKAAGSGPKVSLRSDLLMPRVALVDPLLGLSTPPLLTAACGLDALTQLLEPFVSRDANAFTDGLCREGLPRVGRSLARAVDPGDDVEARTDLALGALFSGLALANARLGAVHGLAAALGHLHASHGEVVARLLPEVVTANLEALNAREPANPALARFDEAARLVLGRSDAHAGDLAPHLQRLVDGFGLPRLAELGVASTDRPAIAQRASRATSMRGNPILLDQDELEMILERAS